MDYLILVNRRTDNDRHITVKTDKTGNWALCDIYTQEKFISSTGDFYAIPFDSGEGRVFRLEEFNDLSWYRTDEGYVLADTFLVDLGSYLLIGPGTHIKATSGGFLYVRGELMNTGQSGVDTVRFAPVEETTSSNAWKGIEITNACTRCHGEGVETIRYNRISNAAIGIKITGRKNGVIYGCRIDNCDTGYYGVNTATNIKYSDFIECTTQGICLNNCNDLLYYSNLKRNERGIDLVGETGIPRIGHCDIDSNNAEGIQSMGPDPIMLYDVTNYPECGYNEIRGNNMEHTTTSNFGGINNSTGSPFLGNSSSWGYNTIWDNGKVELNPSYDHHICTGVDIIAQYNYWGTSFRSPCSSNFTGDGEVTFRPNLTGDSTDVTGTGLWVSDEEYLRGTLDDPGNDFGAGPEYDLVLSGDSLFIARDYEAAIQAYLNVISEYTESPEAVYALKHMKDCYVMMGAFSPLLVQLNAIDTLQINPELVNLAKYLSIDVLVADSLGMQAIALASNAQITSSWPAEYQESAMLKLGYIYKYSLDNFQAGQEAFQQFLDQYPDSPFAPIAAMELGIPWEPRGTSSAAGEKVIGIKVLPEVYALYQNFPNPFNASTTIRYDLPEISDVTLKVYNIMGRNVATLMNGKEAGGYKRINWDGTNRYGGALSSGVYILKLMAKGESGKRFIRTQKMLLLK